MAILNCTPDSFSDGGHFNAVDNALQAAEIALNAGASILDIGGESTRPGAVEVPVPEEIERIQPVITALKTRFPQAILSIDTRKAAVAEVALDAGASIVNDVSGLVFDPAMAALIARYQQAQGGIQLVLMHSRGTPETMTQETHYPEGILKAVGDFFQTQLAHAIAAGIEPSSIILDPGIGFAKTQAQNLTLLKGLASFHRFGCPLLLGTSRKRFLTLGADIPVEQREALTAVTTVAAVQAGAHYIRVHDVVTQAPALRLAEAIATAI